ncbi:MAG: DNA-binding protein WhiA [Butyricicoccus sp.]|nr:DNA-binding protein WhiA [Butyricicoccus sp.]
MVSFSVKTKNELCRTSPGRDCCQRAELYGVLLFASEFSNRRIRLVSAQAALIRRVSALFLRVFGFAPEVKTVGGKRALVIEEERRLRAVLTGLGYDYRSYITYHLNRNMVEEPCCAAAFLRGAFLMAGSVASPEKKSHLEIKNGHATLCREVMSLMLDNGLEPKMAERGNGIVIYWKDSQRIEDFLTTIGAQRAALALMEGKVEKQLRNDINRQVNCETANMIKVTAASTKQIAAIERALSVRGIEIFPENLRQTVDLRVAHPAASLAELAAMFDPPLSKPGLNHRLRKIMEIAGQIEEGE